MSTGILKIKISEERRNVFIFDNKRLRQPASSGSKWLEQAEDMKDVILITTCISVTDACYYDIKDDFNCLKMLSIAAFDTLPLTANSFTASSKNKVGRWKIS